MGMTFLSVIFVTFIAISLLVIVVVTAVVGMISALFEAIGENIGFVFAIFLLLLLSYFMYWR